LTIRASRVNLPAAMKE